VAATDVLPIVDISATETKKVTAKDLFEAGAVLADSGSINIAKLDQSSATKLGATAIADDAITYAKIQNVSATDRVLGRSSAGAGDIQEIPLTAAGRALLDDADAAAQRATLGLGTIATQSASNVAIGGGAITGGSITGITDLAVADGGTGASDAGTARANLGVAIGTNVQAYDAGLQSISGLTTAANQTIYTTGSDTYAVTGLTSAGRALIDDADAAAQRTTLGLGTLATQSGTFSGTHSGTTSGTNTGDQTIILTGDVTGTGTGSFAATIANSAVTTAKIDDSAVTTAKINNGAVTAAKLAADSSLVVSGNEPGANGAYQGQQHLNTNTGITYVWTGAAWQQVAALQNIYFTDSTPITFSVTKLDNFNATITTTLDNQSANGVFAGPTAGNAASPTFRTLVSADLPVATVNTVGAVQPGTGLSVSGAGVLGHTNNTASGTYTKVTVDAEGHVASATTLVAADIPNLDTSKITTGTLDIARLNANSITGAKLANYSVSLIGSSQPTPEHIGQFFFNPLERTLFLWDGNVYQPVGISAGEIVFSGTYDASTNLVNSVTADGAAIGLVVGSGLPAAGASNRSYYVVVSQSGTGTAPAPIVTLEPPDILLSNGTTWVLLEVSETVTAQLASNVQFTATGDIISTNVQAAIAEVDSEKLPKAGGTMTGNLELGTNVSIIFEGSTADGNEITLTVVNPTADRTITLPNVTGTVVTTGDTGTVTSAMIANGAIVDEDINAAAAIADTKLDTISTANKVSISALNIDGGTDIGGALADADLFVVDDGGAGTNRKAAATRISDYTFAKVSGDVTVSNSGIAAIGSGVIVNADVNATAAIAGTKISPDFGSQNVVTTGTATAASFIPTSSTVPTNGLYLPAANSVAVAAGGERLRITSTGTVNIVGAGTAGSTQAVSFNGSAPVNSLIVNSSGHLLVGPGASSLIVPDGGGVNFTPQVFNNQTSGVAGLGVGVMDGVNNRRCALFVDQPNGLVGITSTYGTGPAHSFVICMATQERLRITDDGVFCYSQPTPTSKSAAATLTVAELKTGIIQYTGAAATLTLPTGTLTEGGFSGIYTNMTFEYSVINTGSGTCTIGAGTGHTIVGAATIAAGASGRFAARRTASNTFVNYRLS